MKFIFGCILLIVGLLVGVLFILQILRFIHDFRNLSETTAYEQGYFVGGILVLIFLLLISIGLVLTGKYLITKKPQSTIDN